MSEQRNDLEGIAKRWMTFWQGGDLDAFGEVHHPNFVDCSPSGRGSSRDDLQAAIVDLYRAFPDFMAEIDDLVIDTGQGKVAIRWRALGTHRDVFFGEPASGRRVRFFGIEIITIRKNRVTERWAEWDGLEIGAQLRP